MSRPTGSPRQQLHGEQGRHDERRPPAFPSGRRARQAIRAPRDPRRPRQGEELDHHDPRRRHEAAGHERHAGEEAAACVGAQPARQTRRAQPGPEHVERDQEIRPERHRDQRAQPRGRVQDAIHRVGRERHAEADRIRPARKPAGTKRLGEVGPRRDRVQQVVAERERLARKQGTRVRQHGHSGEHDERPPEPSFGRHRVRMIARSAARFTCPVATLLREFLLVARDRQGTEITGSPLKKKVALAI